MKHQIEKFIVLCRILICLLLILVWSLWIISLPNNQIQNLYALSNTSYIALKKQEEVKKDKPQEIQQKNRLKKQLELPKLVDLKLNEAEKPEKKGTKKEEKPKTNSQKINLPETAEATRKALTQAKIRQNKNSTTNEVTLRNKINISKKDTTSSDSSWLPKYLKEKQGLIKGN